MIKIFVNRFQSSVFRESRRTSTFSDQLIFIRENISEVTNSNMLKIRFENDQNEIHSQFTKDELKIQFENNIITFNEADEMISDVMQNDNKKALKFSKIMSNAQRMFHERNSSTFNIDDKF